MRRTRIALAAILTSGVFLAAASEAPAPDRSKHCSIVTKGEREYRVKARAVSCRFANRWVKRYFRRGRVAPGYRLTKTSGGKAPWYCTRGERKAYWPERI